MWIRRETCGCGSAFDATAVDMEAATVARMAKVATWGEVPGDQSAISDEADFEIGELAKFVTEDGQFREKRHLRCTPRCVRKSGGR